VNPAVTTGFLVSRRVTTSAALVYRFLFPAEEVDVIVEERGCRDVRQLGRTYRSDAATSGRRTWA
jgi:hypothetical protein